MSIEEKAKAYDEALERAKKFAIDDAYASQGIVAKFIFPELRENEDERIRKEIIDFLETIPASELKRIPRPISEWFSWLEKQKKQKPAEWGDEDERTLVHIQSHLKYLIEHRFKIKDYNTMEDRMILESEIKWLENRFKYLCPVKQEWSENDKRILYNVIAYVGYAAGERGVKDDDFKEANEWLKNLRSQPHWKKSLATADLENSLCDLQDNYHDGSYEYKIIGEAIEFIRCTELRPSWKPSKEQMKALEQAKISAVAGNYITKDGLCSLYEQLKKL